MLSAGIWSISRALKFKHNRKKGINIVIILLSFIVSWAFWNDCYADNDMPKRLYFQAYSSYEKIKKNPELYKYRSKWLACIDKFSKVYEADPDGPWAAAGLYMTGILYKELYKYSYKRSDIQEAVDIFTRIIKHFPRSRYTPKSKQELRSIAEKTGKRKTEKIVKPAQASAFDAVITDIRSWSNPNYTRVVIDSNAKVSYKHNLLEQNRKITKPERLYIDFKQSKLKTTIRKNVVINDNLLKSVRAAQFDVRTVRVVIDLKSSSISYNVFTLPDPFRTVIDIYRSDNSEASASVPNIDLKKKSGSSPALAKQLGLGVRRIVIDAGHGGKDYGAPGYYKGVHEKNIVLEIAKRLAGLIKKELGLEVIMTRTNDRYLTLEERTAIANTKKADLFISIHTNAAKNKKAYGIETYFLSPAKSNESMLVAARENSATAKNISDLQAILNSLLRNAKVNESIRLAGYVQKSVCSNLKSKYSNIKNKGVNQALFYVLLGAHMPAILVETSFISNPLECKRLMTADYQERLCLGILEGIKTYMQYNNPNL